MTMQWVQGQNSGDAEEPGDGADVQVAPADLGYQLRDPFPSANLLPDSILLRRQVRKAKRMALMMLAAVLALLLVLFMVAQGAQHKADAEKAVAQQKLTAANAERAQYAQVPLVYNAVAEARQELATAMGQEVQVSSLLAGLARFMPPNVSIETMSTTISAGDTSQQVSSSETVIPGTGSVQFDGQGRSMGDVAAFIESLRRQPDYTNPVLTTVQTAEDGTLDFQVNAELTDQALSGRFSEATQ